MNTIFFRKGVSCLLSLAALAYLDSGLSAVAQTVDTMSSKQPTPLTAQESANQVIAQRYKQSQNPSAQTPAKSSLVEVDSALGSNSSKFQQQRATIATQKSANQTVIPVPGTTATSSAALAPQYTQAQFKPSASSIAQTDVEPGRPTRGGRSYIGIGANIGVSGGDSSLSDGNFMVISKVGLTNAISVRPSAVFGDNTTVLVPVTYDLSLRQTDPFEEPLAIAPYIGAGAAIKTEDDAQVAFLATGGIDVPLNAQFTATAAVNAAFFDETDVGLLLGVGYNFPGF